MDNLTHSLTGWALGKTGLARVVPHGMVLLLISANIPDSDIVALTRGPLAYLVQHRGYTHSFIGMPVMALLAVLVTAALFRKRLPWFRSWLLAMVGVGSHLLLDWTNSYGVRPLIPFSSQWYHLDINGLYDAVILTVLGFALVWPMFSKLVSGEIGSGEVSKNKSGRGSAIFALIVFVLFDLGRLTLHQRAVMQLDAWLYDDETPLQAAAMPDSFNPFAWHGIVETRGTYRLLPVSSFKQVEISEARVFHKPPTPGPIERAQAAEEIRFFLYFARFPVWSVEQVTLRSGATAQRVDLTDLRFGTPNHGAFHAGVLESKDGRLLKSWFTFGSGADLGQE